MVKIDVYTDALKDTRLSEGFFDGWPNPPSKDKHRLILEQSYCSVVAIDEDKNEIIGFVNAISDGVLSAYIPLLEVVKPYQGQGIATKLVQHLIDELSDLYMIDLSCDKDLVSFYEKFKMIQSNAMMLRNYQNQSGRDL